MNRWLSDDVIAKLTAQPNQTPVVESRWGANEDRSVQVRIDRHEDGGFTLAEEVVK